MAHINLSYENTFNVFDNITKVRIGQIALMNDGWAGYGVTATGRIRERRIGTYPDAEQAIRAVEVAQPSLRKRLALAHA
jgi:hypothetical protein